MIRLCVRLGLVAVMFWSSASAALAAGGDLADGYLRARRVVAAHLSEVKLNSVYGTPAFDEKGRRVDDLFLNFTGRDAKGRPMLMSLTLAPDGALTGEHEADNPRLDRFGHHAKPGLELDAWFPPEEAVAIAIASHPGHPPTQGISLAYHNSTEFGNRVVMVLYWVHEGRVRDVVLDARYGRVLEVGDQPAPGKRPRAR